MREEGSEGGRVSERAESKFVKEGLPLKESSIRTSNPVPEGSTWTKERNTDVVFSRLSGDKAKPVTGWTGRNEGKEGQTSNKTSKHP